MAEQERQKMSARKNIDWTKADWTKSAAEIAKDFGCSLNTVYLRHPNRKSRPRKSPAIPPEPSANIFMLRLHREILNFPEYNHQVEIIIRAYERMHQLLKSKLAQGEAELERLHRKLDHLNLLETLKQSGHLSKEFDTKTVEELDAFLEQSLANEKPTAPVQVQTSATSQN